MSALEIVAAVNSLLQLVANSGLAWQNVSAAINTAHVEGRPFGVEDLDALAAQARASLDKLDDAIRQAKLL
jgi:hypothetical protein